ncbi:hypothetical protein AC578_6709 [Pseudocercospora eumusae]|uniref:Uncharacterized protein n=1 Tax=Pseudocercospora eumusae TaxID=321146 RepID=A0A139HHZ0_9PEZI|nr:hypothetical protein AC578_6709 [Pseudocercospora eumusae]
MLRQLYREVKFSYYADPDRPIYVDLDACAAGCAAVLYHVQHNPEPVVENGQPMRSKPSTRRGAENTYGENHDIGANYRDYGRGCDSNDRRGRREYGRDTRDTQQRNNYDNW